MLDNGQLISGLSVLLSFFVGYKYGLKTVQQKEDSEEDSGASSSSKVFSFVFFFFDLPANFDFYSIVPDLHGLWRRL
jgi:hypothetical protein